MERQTYHDAFISFSSKDSEKALEVVNTLQSKYGIRCWICTREIVGGTNYKDAIMEALLASPVVVFIQSEASLASPEVSSEIGQAFKHRKIIIPFILDQSEATGRMAYNLTDAHCVDATKPEFPERIDELAASIQRNLVDTAVSHKHIPNDHKEVGKLTGGTIIPNKNFIGREKELAEIKKLMDQYNKLFIQGMGGIGKSEIAKSFALQNSSDYSTVVFATYQTSLSDLIIYDAGFRAEAISRIHDKEGNLEEDAVFSKRKLAWMQENLHHDTLIIIDNFDTEMDPLLEEFLHGAYSVIFTTRNDFSQYGLPTYQLTPFIAETEQYELFAKYYPLPLSPSDQIHIYELLRWVGGHTLTIELLAKHIYHRRLKPQAALALLTERGISVLNAGKVVHGFNKQFSAYEHIRQLFSLSALTVDEQQMMKNLSLIPVSGIDFIGFCELCELDDYCLLESLIARSWIRHEPQCDIISLHPVIKDIVTSELSPNLTSCSTMIHNLSGKLRGLWAESVETKQLYTEICKAIYLRFPQIDPAFIGTYMAIAYAFSLTEQNTLADQVNRNCLEACRKAYGENSKETAGAYYQIGDNNLYLNNWADAIDYLSKAVDILTIAQPDSLHLAYMIKHLCWIRLRSKQDPLVTEQLLHQSYRILKNQNPENIQQMASQNSAYANVYFELHQYELALEYAEKSYSTFHKLYGDMHGDTLSPICIKARILSKLGRARESIDLILYVIDLQKRLNGDHHQKVLNRYEFLAEIYEDCRRIPEALDVLQQIEDALKAKNDVTSPFYLRISEAIQRLSAKPNPET